MDSITRIKNFISDCFPHWSKVDFSEIDANTDFRKDWSELYRINEEETILISYTNISITGTERLKPQLRVFLDEYKKPFLFAKKHNLRFYLFSIFTKEDEMAKGLNNFNPKEYIISIETNLDIESSRRDLRSIYDYANEKLNGRKFLKCSRENYKADINQASLIYIGTPENPEKETFECFINIFDSRPYLNSTLETNHNDDAGITNSALQKIYYGAPGTGKSHKIKDLITQKGIDEKTHVFRTTFHPDSDYSTFVGAYKPTMAEKAVRDTAGNVALDKNKEEIYEEVISYKFVPQAFLKAYIQAYNDPDHDVVLVIEEINRGNCAQIFGDLFQLLDRKGGKSEYPIKADDDILRYLKFGVDEKGNKVLTNPDGYANDELCLPSNLYIWATMNTSDQSLFPIDSAFKRRWEWEYIKIIQPKDTEKEKFSERKLEDGTKWWAFLQQINKIIASMTSSADKQLGFFFAKPDQGDIISNERFVNKVIFYLWNDVFKDYAMDEGKLFKFKPQDTDGKELEERDLTYPDFYDDDQGKKQDYVIEQFIKHVMEWEVDKKPEN